MTSLVSGEQGFDYPTKQSYDDLDLLTGLPLFRAHCTKVIPEFTTMEAQSDDELDHNSK